MHVVARGDDLIGESAWYEHRDSRSRQRFEDIYPL